MQGVRRHVLALDSGVGGLGIVRALRDAIPGVAVTYLADNAFRPYGDKPDAVLTGRLVGLVGGLVRAVAPDLVVIACNTASTIALAELRRAIPRPFVGTVPPVKWAASLSATRTIGLLATEATVGRAYVADLQRRFAPDCRLVARAAPGLVELAERQFVGGTVADAEVAAELAPLLDAEGGDAIDAVCLGCTHFGLLLPALRRVAPENIAWLDPAGPVARRTAELLGALPASASAPAPADRAFVTAPFAEQARFAAALRAYGFGGLDVFEVLDVLEAELVPEPVNARG